MEPTGSDVKEVDPTPTGVPMVSMEGVNKHFGSLHVLKDINLKVDRGQVIVVLGPVWFGQVDVVPRDQSAGAHRLRNDRDRRGGTAPRGQEASATAVRRGHGVPVIQPVRAQDNPGQRDAGTDEGAQEIQDRGPRDGDDVAGTGRHRQSGGQVSGAAVRWSAATRGDRTLVGDEPEGDAVRRAHQRAGSRNDQRGAKRDDHAGQGRNDHDCGDPRDGFRARRRQSRGLHGRRGDRRVGRTHRVLQQPEVRPR